MMWTGAERWADSRRHRRQGRERPVLRTTGRGVRIPTVQPGEEEDDDRRDIYTHYLNKDWTQLISCILFLYSESWNLFRLVYNIGLNRLLLSLYAWFTSCKDNSAPPAFSIFCICSCEEYGIMQTVSSYDREPESCHHWQMCSCSRLYFCFRMITTSIECVHVRSINCIEDWQTFSEVGCSTTI